MSGFGEGRDWLWDHAPCGYVRAEADGRLTHVNTTLLEWLQMTEESACACEFIDLLDERSKTQLLKRFRPELRGAGQLENAKLTMSKADGSALEVVVSAVFDTDETGEPCGIRAVIDLADRPSHSQDLLNAENRAGRSESRAMELLQALQRTLIPAAMPEISGLDVAAEYSPASGEVGGDFYDVFEVVADDWCVVLGDVSGKGIEAAIVTAEARHAVRTSALREPTPRGLLGALNAALVKEESTRFCTVALARVHVAHDEVVATIATGGHPFPLLVRHGTVTRMGRAGSLLGVFDDVEFTDVSIKLASGDALVLYTDGVIEARDATGEFFGEERLHEAIAGADASAQAIADAVMKRVADFQAPGGEDDIALVVIRRP